AADAAGFTDVDREDIRGFGIGEVARVLNGVNAFIGDDRLADARVNLVHTVDVAGRNRLLDEIHIVLDQMVDNGNGGIDGFPSAVSVNAQAHVAADGFAHRLDAGNIAFGIDADLHFHLPEPHRDRLPRDLRRLLRLAAGNGPFRLHNVAHFPAEEL